jgi:GNAT superfamily N-acetyltransferase
LEPRILRLTTLGQARALGRCVFDTYGLTFHRSYLYDAERTLALNEATHLTSWLAMEGDEVVGHLAAIRPDYEFSDQHAPGWGARVRELGLGMVRPSHRQRGVQASLVGPALEWCFDHGIRGNFTKCVTHHAATQRIALENGGCPVCILLGGVPSWVRYDDPSSPEGQKPISTLVFYRSFSPTGPERVYLPEADEDLFRSIYARLEDQREFGDLSETPSHLAPTVLRVFFDPNKQTGRVHVLHAGPDVETEVLACFRWLAAGRLRHVTVVSPLGSPFTARAVDGWKRAGMVFGGVLPCLTGCDVAVYQGVYQDRVCEDDIVVLDELSRRIRARALEDHACANSLPLPSPETCGGFFPPSVCL